MRKELFSKVRRLCVKVGSSVLTAPEGGLDQARVSQIAQGVAELVRQGCRVILVSSGAIATGMSVVGETARPKTLARKQAMAAIGQGQLMHRYDKLFHERGLATGQILLTREDLRDRARYANARNTLLTLLDYGAVPIVNENDTVAVEEIQVGDNDRLSALVAQLAGCELLVMLTDQPGLMGRGADGRPELLRVIPEITPEIERLAKGPGGASRTGGMVTKIEAAKMAVRSGIAAVVADGRSPGVLRRILLGEELGTLFIPSPEHLSFRKRWIAFGPLASGKIIVDPGAREALAHREKSLLASGITALEGNFQSGSVVAIAEAGGGEFARGIVRYSSQELGKIQGRSSREIEGILGHKYHDEVVHRDDLVILKR